MAGDRIVRIVALLVLCALVYWLSFNQGIDTAKARLTRLGQALAAKDERISRLLMENRRLREELAQQAEEAALRERENPINANERLINLRLGSAREVLPGRVWVALLGASREDRQVRLKINHLAAGRTWETQARLGESLEIEDNGFMYLLVVREIRLSSVNLQLLGGPG